MPHRCSLNMILKKFKSTATDFVGLFILVSIVFLFFVLVCGLVGLLSLVFLLCKIVSQQEIVSLYQRFCQLDRNAKGFISADEFLSVPEFAMNPLSQVLHWNFVFVSSLSLEIESASVCLCFGYFSGDLWKVMSMFYCFLQRLLKMVDGLNFKDFVAFLSAFSAKASMHHKIECKWISCCCLFIFYCFCLRF